MSEKFETEAPGPDVMEAENRTENVDGSVRLDPEVAREAEPVICQIKL